MEADVNGPQRTVFVAEVRPAKATHGTSGVALRDGKTLPFVVTRSWVAPAGYYDEAWYLVDPATREVLHEEPVGLTKIWGLQGLTPVTSEVVEPVPLKPGTYQIVFALGGIKGGELDVEAVDVAATEAA